VSEEIKQWKRLSFQKPQLCMIFGPEKIGKIFPLFIEEKIELFQ